MTDDVRRAVGLGFVSHFGLDAVPHFGVDDEHLMKVAVPDGLVGLATIATIARATPPRRLLPVLAGIFGACLPDLDKPARVFFGRSPFPRWFDRAHAGIQDEAVHRFDVELVAAAGFALALTVLLRRGTSLTELSGATPRGSDAAG